MPESSNRFVGRIVVSVANNHCYYCTETTWAEINSGGIKDSPVRRGKNDSQRQSGSILGFWPGVCTQLVVNYPTVASFLPAKFPQNEFVLIKSRFGKLRNISIQMQFRKSSAIVPRK